MRLISILIFAQRIFPINILDLYVFSMISNKIDEYMIWHHKYDYLKFNTIKLLLGSEEDNFLKF